MYRWAVWLEDREVGGQLLNGKCFHGVGDRLFPTYGNTSDKNVLIRRCL
jgi:hypothetical protein